MDSKTQEYYEKLNSFEIQLKELDKFIEEISKITWRDETVISFYKKQKGLSEFNGRLIGFIQNYLDSLNNINYEELKNSLIKCNQQCTKLQSEKYSNYNEPYKSYIGSYIEKLQKQIISFFETINKSQRIEEYYKNLLNGINQLQKGLIPNINELFEHFKYGNKNYVIFGKNGSGKTTLLNHISKELFKNAIVIPANRRPNQPTSSSVTLNNQYNLNEKLADNNSLMYLIRDINNQTLESYEKGMGEHLRQKFYSIFSSLSLDRNIIANKDVLYLQGDNIEKYSLNNGSDGEKSAAYVIMATLLTPLHSFLFIDEPETHLNGALLRNLFDKLELERPDLCFIYLTHNTDFVESRKNVELIYLEKTDNYNNWKFKAVKDYDDISLDVILSIEGTKSNIIFCEGDRSSIDCKILECLFPQYEIKPVGSCEQVKLNTKGINGKEALFKRKAFGLVDNDYMQEIEIEALKEDNIFAIGYNEWENFLIRSEILEYINKKHLDKDLLKVKNDVVEHIKNRAQKAILSDFITKRYTKMLYATNLTYNDDLSGQIDRINEKNKSTLIDEMKNLVNKINSSDDYDELVSIVPAKMLLGKVALGIGLASSKDYVELIVKNLKQDKDFNNKIIQLLNISLE